MGPPQHSSAEAEVQAPRCHPRVRRCLRAQCGCVFHPCCARRFYCSPECRAAARAQSQRDAQRKYRASPQGRCCRQEQSRRYRARCRERRAVAGKAVSTRLATAREGHHQQPGGRKICCDRPGCYNRFVISSRSPLQRFCSPLCRQEFRRARALDRRWRGVCAGCPREAFVDRLPEARDGEMRASY